MRTMIELLIIIIILSCILGSIFEHTRRGGCAYNTIVTKYNPAYRLGCELAKERF